MKQNIEIEVPEGYEAFYNKEAQKIELVKIDNRPKSWNEFCDKSLLDINKKEYFIDADSTFRSITVSGRRHVCRDKNLLESKEECESFLALIQLYRLRKSWIGNWESNWENSSNKWVISYSYNNFVVYSVGCNSRILSFPTEKMATEFKDCFKDLLEKAKSLI